MNKLIRDIAIQTDAWCDKNGSVKAAEWEEKFAELILKECMDICDSTQAQYGQYTFTATTVKNRIKERFGVEE
jgi:hypothetical protein